MNLDLLPGFVRLPAPPARVLAAVRRTQSIVSAHPWCRVRRLLCRFCVQRFVRAVWTAWWHDRRRLPGFTLDNPQAFDWDLARQLHLTVGAAADPRGRAR